VYSFERFVACMLSFIWSGAFERRWPRSVLTAPRVVCGKWKATWRTRRRSASGVPNVQSMSVLCAVSAWIIGAKNRSPAPTVEPV
jgi:hypothetical protein